MNEVYYVELHIIEFLMEGRVEMRSNDARFNISHDVSVVRPDSIHQKKKNSSMLTFGCCKGLGGGGGGGIALGRFQNSKKLGQGGGGAKNMQQKIRRLGGGGHLPRLFRRY